MTSMDNREARIRARLAWNGWPDNENSRREIAAHEQRDPVSAAAWDRVIAALEKSDLAPTPDFSWKLEMARRKAQQQADFWVRWLDGSREPAREHIEMAPSQLQHIATFISEPMPKVDGIGASPEPVRDACCETGVLPDLGPDTSTLQTNREGE